MREWRSSMPLAALLESDEQERAAEMAAFTGCLRGGMAEWLNQGSDDVLIYGAGVWLSREVRVVPWGNAHPMVLADRSLLGYSDHGTAVLAYDYPALISHLSDLTGGAQPARDLVAVSSDVPREHFNEAETANPGTADQGVLGAAGTMNGNPCILTAGHVAARNALNPVGPGTGLTLTDTSGLAEPVVFATHAGTTTKRDVVADIAVVQLGTSAGRGPGVSGTGSPWVDDTLTRLGGSNTGVGGVAYRGFCSWVRVDQRQGLWGELFMTERQLGVPGDSGSPVVNSGNQIVGHYLGATAANGFVQQLAFQLPQGCVVP